MFCQNRKVEPKGGLQVFQILEALQEFWLWWEENMNRKMILLNEGKREKIYFLNGLQKCLSPIVSSHCPKLVLLPSSKKKKIHTKMLLFKNIAENIQKLGQLGQDVVGLQLKTPYHVLKLSSIGKSKKGAFAKWVRVRVGEKVQSKRGLKVSSGESHLR